MSAQLKENPMRRVYVQKVVMNIGVGRSGEAVERAQEVLRQISGRTPIQTRAKKTVRDFGVRKGEPIGAKVTLMGDEAVQLLKKLLIAKGLKLPSSSFDDEGNVSFGIKEHIEIPGIKYDPDTGIFGLDVNVKLERPGYRVARRRLCPSKVGKKHKVKRDEAIQFMKDIFKVEVT
ncbi:MAG: 50S ribosomal protein L5 [Nitrososphaeria archaeon]